MRKGRKLVGTQGQFPKTKKQLCGACAIDVRLFRSALLDNCGSRHPLPAACQPGSPWEESDMKDGEIADQTFDQTPSLMCVLYICPLKRNKPTGPMQGSGHAAWSIHDKRFLKSSGQQEVSNKQNSAQRTWWLDW